MNFVIKICGVTVESDARLAVESGANAIGFNFYRRSPRYVSLETASAIARTLPDTMTKVGVFVEPEEEELQQAIDRVPLDVVQLHGRRVPSIAHRTWRALTAAIAEPSESLLAEAIVLDAETPDHGGSGKVWDWRLATRFWQPVILAGGLHAGNVAEAIEIAQPAGVDACSLLESTPGRKDARKVREFVEAAREASQALARVAS